MPTHSPLHSHDDNGYILLISVLVTGALASSIAVALLTLSSSVLQTAQVQQEVSQARALNDACVEEAIIQLERDTAYSGGTTLTLTNGSCVVVSVEGSGDVNRVVNVESTVGRTTQRVSATLSSVGHPSVVSSWQRVADF
ncbi:MAG: hypothetical protein KIH62_004570 [Candidatus Kerfeldbacteria bacterium]|nr:hypothetical protein [Candidatus Kerfeldbacteria bacterium]